MIPTDLIPKKFKYFIAGGWAVCPALAQDRDLFVQTAGDLDETHEELLAHLEAKGWDYEPSMESPKDLREEPPSAPDARIVLKVAKVKPYRAQPIHILVTNATVRDVLNSFDLSICQIAITSTGHIVQGEHWTSIIETIAVLKDTPTTAARLAKYRARFRL